MQATPGGVASGCATLSGELRSGAKVQPRELWGHSEGGSRFVRNIIKVHSSSAAEKAGHEEIMERPADMEVALESLAMHMRS